MTDRILPATLDSGPGDGPLLLLAHGAGAPMDSPFMERLAALLTERNVATRRFEFRYMARRREDGRKRPPDRMPALENAFRSAVAEAREHWPGRSVAIGGKSMGGRVATHVADAVDACAVVVFGYPFHPPGKPDAPRTTHLHGLAVPTLILQGTRDPFGKRGELEAWQLPDGVAVHWLEDGDHDLKPRVASGRTWRRNLEEAADATAGFLRIGRCSQFRHDTPEPLPAR